MTYLLTKGVLAGTIKFLRVPGAAISWILGKFSTSERARKRTWANQYMSYGIRVPSDALAILILLVFSFVQPLVAVAATLYFMLASLYWKYDMMYSYRDSFQTGGMFWPVVCSSCLHLVALHACTCISEVVPPYSSMHVAFIPLLFMLFLLAARHEAALVQMFDMIYSSVIIFLLTAIGVLGVKESPGPALLTILLVGAIVWRIVVQKKLARPLKEMSMHTAADLDRQDLVRLAPVAWHQPDKKFLDCHSKPSES